MLVNTKMTHQNLQRQVRSLSDKFEKLTVKLKIQKAFLKLYKMNARTEIEGLKTRITKLECMFSKVANEYTRNIQALNEATPRFYNNNFSEQQQHGNIPVQRLLELKEREEEVIEIEDTDDTDSETEDLESVESEKISEPFTPKREPCSSPGLELTQPGERSLEEISMDYSDFLTNINQKISGMQKQGTRRIWTAQSEPNYTLSQDPIKSKRKRARTVKDPWKTDGEDSANTTTQAPTFKSNLKKRKTKKSRDTTPSQNVLNVKKKPRNIRKVKPSTKSSDTETDNDADEDCHLKSPIKKQTRASKRHTKNSNENDTDSRNNTTPSTVVLAVEKKKRQNRSPTLRTKTAIKEKKTKILVKTETPPLKSKTKSNNRCKFLKMPEPTSGAANLTGSSNFNNFSGTQTDGRKTRGRSHLSSPQKQPTSLNLMTQSRHASVICSKKTPQQAVVGKNCVPTTINSTSDSSDSDTPYGSKTTGQLPAQKQPIPQKVYLESRDGSYSKKMEENVVAGVKSKPPFYNSTSDSSDTDTDGSTAKLLSEKYLLSVELKPKSSNDTSTTKAAEKAVHAKRKSTVPNSISDSPDVKIDVSKTVIEIPLPLSGKQPIPIKLKMENSNGSCSRETVRKLFAASKEKLTSPKDPMEMDIDKCSKTTDLLTPTRKQTLGHKSDTKSKESKKSQDTIINEVARNETAQETVFFAKKSKPKNCLEFSNPDSETLTPLHQPHGLVKKTNRVKDSQPPDTEKDNPMSQLPSSNPVVAVKSNPGVKSLYNSPFSEVKLISAIQLPIVVAAKSKTEDSSLSDSDSSTSTQIMMRGPNTGSGDAKTLRIRKPKWLLDKQPNVTTKRLSESVPKEKAK